MVDKKDSQFRIRARSLIGEGNPIWQEDPDFIGAFNEIEEITIVSPYRCYTLFQLAQHCNGVEGDFAQVGVYKGGSAKLIASVKDPEKSFHLFDTFEGLPEHNPEIDVYQKGKFGDVSLEEVVALFEEDKTVQIHKGRFPGTARNLPYGARFAFVYLDLDLYRSNIDSLEFFYPRMTAGGAIIFDDYGFENCPGIKRSVDEYLAESGAREVPIITTKYQAMIIKS